MRHDGQDKAGRRRIRSERRDRKRTPEAKAETLELRALRTLKRAPRKVAHARAVA